MKGLCNRFEEQGIDDIVEEFMRFRQENFVVVLGCIWRVEGENRKGDAWIGWGIFSIRVYNISGLRDDIRPMMRMIKLANSYEAFEMARLKEQLLENSRKLGSPYKPYYYPNTLKNTYQTHNSSMCSFLNMVRLPHLAKHTHTLLNHPS